MGDMKLMFDLFMGAPGGKIATIELGLKLMADVFQKFIEAVGYG